MTLNYKLVMSLDAFVDAEVSTLHVKCVHLVTFVAAHLDYLLPQVKSISFRVNLPLNTPWHATGS